MHFIKDGSDTYTLRVAAKPGRKRLTGTPIVINGHSGVTDRTIEIKIEGVKDTTPLYYLSQSQCH